MPDLFDIRGCALSFKCEKEWSSLIPTTDSNIRICEECKQNVKFCSTYEEFVDMADIGHCVAFPSLRESGLQGLLESEPYVTVGIPIVRRKPKD